MISSISGRFNIAQGTPAPPSSPSKSPTTYALPGKAVEAENYADMSERRHTQPTTDIGGGHESWTVSTKAGDYMDYSG